MKQDCIYIYLAGNIKKGKEDDNEDVWTQQDMDLLQQHVTKKIVFLNPATRSDDLSDQKSVFGRDLFQVYSSHLVLVDARGKRGLGVGAEMLFAKTNRIPVVSWLPQDSHYQRETIHLLGQQVNAWIHPFVYNLSDYLAPSLEAAAEWIENELFDGLREIKGPESLNAAINHYLDTQHLRDEGLYELVKRHPHFNERIDLLNCPLPF